MRTSLVPLSICLWEVRACVGRRGCRPLQVCGKSLLEKRFILRVLDFKAAVAKEVEEAGEKTSAFEMVSPPRKQLKLNAISKAKILNYARSPFMLIKSII